MDVEVHQGAVRSLVPEWGALFRADPAAAPFSSPEWALAWWSHWGQGADPWFVAVRDGGRLVGLAPLVRRRRGPVGVLHVVGEGPSDYWEVLALPEVRDEVTAAVAEELSARRREWDVVVARGVVRGSSTERTVTDSRVRSLRRASSPSPRLALPESFDAYLAGLPTRRRGTMRRHLRRLDGGEVRLRELGPADDLAAAMDRWFALRLKQWSEARGREIDPAHPEARFRAFGREVAVSLVPAGLAFL